MGGIGEKNGSKGPGFTIVEMVLVLFIAGVLLMAVIPRAFRAQGAARMAIVRHTGCSLASWGMIWARRCQDSQGPDNTAGLNSYVASLSAGGGWVHGPAANWAAPAPYVPVTGGTVRNNVSEIMPADLPLLNPFSGRSVFDPADPDTAPGVLRLVLLASEGYNHYYLIFRGPDGGDAWYGAMGDGNLDALERGVFMARLRQ